MTERKRGSLELNWVNKDKSLLYEYDENGNPKRPKKWVEKDDLRVSEPRHLRLIEEFGEESENLLVKGDNLLALRSLVEKFKNRSEKEKVKCIYIDPPYNTGRAFPIYEDNLKHSEWLTLMRDRLLLLKRLLRQDGYICVQIDDQEFAGLYFLMQEIFGEDKLKTICVKMAEPTGVKMTHVERTGIIPKLKEYIIIAKMDGIRGFELDRLPKEEWDNEYKNLVHELSKDDYKELKNIMENENRSEEDIKRADGILSKIQLSNVETYLDENDIKDPKEREKWKFSNAWRIARTVATTKSAKKMADEKRKETDQKFFTITTPRDKMYIIKGDYDESQSQPRIKLLFADDYLTVHPGDFWSKIKTTGLGNEGDVDLTKGKKPEALLKRIIGMGTEKNDIVLDAFLGSGTTAAVAHKMERRWIGIEILPNHYQKSLKRLKRVISKDSPDKTGISKDDDIDWDGGGGFKSYELSQSILTQDKEINWIHSEKEVAQSLFWMFDFTFGGEINELNPKLKEGMGTPIYVGENKNKLGLSIVSENLDIIKKSQLEKIIEKIRKEYNADIKIEIYTNKGVGVKKEDLPEKVSIRAVPECVLSKYKVGERKE